FGLYAAVSLQKAVRDKEEGIPVTVIYFGLSWFALIAAVSLMAIGLYNAGSIILSEKGFYAMAFALSLFSAVTLQKNIRDAQESEDQHKSKNVEVLKRWRACWTLFHGWNKKQSFYLSLRQSYLLVCYKSFSYGKYAQHYQSCSS